MRGKRLSEIDEPRFVRYRQQCAADFLIGHGGPPEVLDTVSVLDRAVTMIAGAEHPTKGLSADVPRLLDLFRPA